MRNKRGENIKFIVVHLKMFSRLNFFLLNTNKKKPIDYGGFPTFENALPIVIEMIRERLCLEKETETGGKEQKNTKLINSTRKEEKKI